MFKKKQNQFYLQKFLNKLINFVRVVAVMILRKLQNSLAYKNFYPRRRNIINVLLIFKTIFFIMLFRVKSVLHS